MAPRPVASLCLAAALGLAVACGAPARAEGAPPDFDPGLIPDPVVLMPAGPSVGTVFLFSDHGGWSDADAATAQRLQHAGAAVVGIDLPAYFAAIEAAPPKGDEDCAYLVADFERIGEDLGRASGATSFHAPLVAGTGEGGALAIDILGQTPADTLGGAFAANPAAGQGLTRRLCMAFDRVPAGDGSRSNYALPAGPQPAPLTVVIGSDAGPEAAARLAALQGAGVALTPRMTSTAGETALGDVLAATLAAASVPANAPEIVELPATPTRDTMAIMVSGDGGWRDIDRAVAGLLQAKGVPTVGLDTLRWFWTPRTPEETAAELARLIDLYTDRWDVRQVILAGYSFGASVLPAAYLAMPAEAQAKVAEIALMAPGVNADWQITVSGWLGSTSSRAVPVAPSLTALPLNKVLCLYGEEEADSACPLLAGTAATVIRTAGGHHFDGNYDALAQHLLDGPALAD